MYIILTFTRCSTNTSQSSILLLIKNTYIDIYLLEYIQKLFFNIENYLLEPNII